MAIRGLHQKSRETYSSPRIWNSLVKQGHHIGEGFPPDFTDTSIRLILGQEGVMIQRRKFSAEYKREPVAMLETAGVTVRQLAMELGIGGKTLGRWRRERRQEPTAAFRGPGKPRDEEVVQLKRELVRVTKERDFLREAAAFFASGSR
ncbi:MAG: transposase [Nitrospira sp.]|nr:transposase [Nitrospira sp.]